MDKVISFSSLWHVCQIIMNHHLQYWKYCEASLQYHLLHQMNA